MGSGTLPKRHGRPPTWPARPAAARLKSYRRRLLALTARLRSEVTARRGEAFGAAGAAGDVSELLADRGEWAGHSAEGEVAFSLLGSEEAIQAEVTAALARIAAGTFGRCQSCGKSIPRARLRAVPYARHCVACARDAGSAPAAEEDARS